MKGYRGFLREMLRTGSPRALGLQVRTGVLHALRRLVRRGPADPVALFFERYGPDGFRPADPARRALQEASEGCLVCGLCSLECARVAGRPRLDPRDAVLSAARLEIDLVRLQLAEPVATTCAGCAACDAVCPAHIPIHRVQEGLAALDGPSRAGEAPRPPATADWRGPRGSGTSAQP